MERVDSKEQHQCKKSSTFGHSGPGAFRLCLCLIFCLRYDKSFEQFLLLNCVFYQNFAADTYVMTCGQVARWLVDWLPRQLSYKLTFWMVD